MKSTFKNIHNELSGNYILFVITIISSLLLIVNFQLDAILLKSDMIRNIWGSYDGALHSFYLSVTWVINCISFYAIIPLVLALTVFRKKVATVGLGFGELKQFRTIILVIIGVMIPILYIAAGTPAFKNTYPMMRVPILKYIIIWEILYLIQFFAVEFLFRGLLLQPFCEKFGIAGIFFHITPYCLIHFDKPMPEAIGSIFAGLFLGYIAYKSKSIWGGVIIHGSVALLMDIFTLVRM